MHDRTVLEVLADWHQTTPERILTVRNAKPETTCRQLFFWYLHTWDRWTHQMIADCYGWSEGTVRYGIQLVERRRRTMPGFALRCRDLVRSQLRVTA